MKAGAKSEFVGQVANLRPIANRPPRFFLTVAAVVATISAALLTAQKTNSGPILSLTATTDNVAGAPAAIRIDLLRWSTDAERDQLSAAWAMTPRPAASGRGGAKGRAGAARGPAAADDDTSDPFGSFGRNNDKGGAAARGGRGGAAPEGPRQTPEGSLKEALGRVPTVGYFWSPEVAGYALRSAIRVPTQDGGERILLITDRRLGATNDLWKANGTATTYEFSVIELRLNAKGEGEGKISLTSKIAADPAAKTLALEDYAASPVVLKNIKRRSN